jgi:hypothetical protein
MRPQAMKDWAEWFVSSGAQVEQVGSTSPGGSSRTAFSGDLLC